MLYNLLYFMHAIHFQVNFVFTFAMFMLYLSLKLTSSALTYLHFLEYVQDLPGLAVSK